MELRINRVRINRSRPVKKFQCFYHPERLEYAYFGTENHSLVIFTFVFGILLILIPVTIFCCIFIKINKELQCCPKESCWKTREKIGRLHTFTYCHSNSRDHVTRSLENGSYKICKLLVKKTNVNRKLFIYGTKLSPFGVAANYGHIKIKDYLVSIGASLNYVHLSEQKGIFHLACDSESEDAVKWCIDKKLPINQIDSSHRTPLSSYLITVPSPSLPLLKRMIDAGADVNTKDFKNLTPLHLACIKNNTHKSETNNQVIALLIKSGCISHQIIRKTNNPTDHWTPFTSLLLQKEYSLYTLLLEAGYQLKKDHALVYVTGLSPDI